MSHKTHEDAAKIKGNTSSRETRKKILETAAQRPARSSLFEQLTLEDLKAEDEGNISVGTLRD